MQRRALLFAMLIALPVGVRAQEPAEEPAEEMATPVAAEPASEPMAGGSEMAREAIDRGLRAYWRHNWAGAQAEFQMALDADPQSAAAAFYLGYSIYKQAEFRPFHPDKERAKEMFARAFELDPTFAPTFQLSGR
jgi:tetratricopeptide (TPR) repeat protein